MQLSSDVRAPGELDAGESTSISPFSGISDEIPTSSDKLKLLLSHNGPGKCYYTETEAWWYLADAWLKAKFDKDSGCWAMVADTEVEAICSGIVIMNNENLISDSTMDTMLNRVAKYRLIAKKQAGLYVWPRNKNGSLARAEFCKTQAENPIDLNQDV